MDRLLEFWEGSRFFLCFFGIFFCLICVFVIVVFLVGFFFLGFCFLGGIFLIIFFGRRVSVFEREVIKDLKVVWKEGGLFFLGVFFFLDIFLRYILIFCLLFVLLDFCFSLLEYFFFVEFLNLSFFF